MNYQSVQFLFTIYNITNAAETMDDLQAMEAAVITEFNERKG